jgi:hypothetical protein
MERDGGTRQGAENCIDKKVTKSKGKDRKQDKRCMQRDIRRIEHELRAERRQVQLRRDEEQETRS